MSYRTLRYLYCDGNKDECPFEDGCYCEGIGPEDTIADQRRRAAVNGWLVAQPGGKDYCASCQAKLKNDIRSGLR